MDAIQPNNHEQPQPPPVLPIAPPRLIANPYHDIPPNVESDDQVTTLIRDALMNAGSTREQANQAILEMWTQENNRKRQQWDQQIADDEAEKAQRENDKWEANRQAEIARVQALEAEMEKKRVKIPGVDMNKSISSHVIPNPSQYAIQLLKDKKYVPLYYFTRKGCAEAREQNLRYEADPEIGLEEDREGRMSLRRARVGHRASPNETPDDRRPSDLDRHHGCRTTSSGIHAENQL